MTADRKRIVGYTSLMDANPNANDDLFIFNFITPLGQYEKQNLKQINKGVETKGTRPSLTLP